MTQYEFHMLQECMICMFYSECVLIVPTPNVSQLHIINRYIDKLGVSGKKKNKKKCHQLKIHCVSCRAVCYCCGDKARVQHIVHRQGVVAVSPHGTEPTAKLWLLLIRE